MNFLIRLLPPGHQVRPERPLAIGGSEPEPDLAVVQGSPADWLHAHPTTAVLVIEIAVASADIDEGKASIYAEAGIAEYWIVQPEHRAVTVYREPSADTYGTRTVLTDRDTLRCAALPGVEIPIASVLPPKP